MVMKKRLSWIGYILAFILSLSFLGCEPRRPYSIGFIGPMTGPSANIGVEGYRGFTMAIEEANKSGGTRGREVVVHLRDDRSEPDFCLEAARELVDRGVSIIVLHTTSGAAAGALPWLLSQDVLILTRTVSDPAWAGLDDNFLRFVGSTEVFGQPLGRFAASRHRSAIGILVDLRNAGFANSMTTGFLAAAGALPLTGRLEVGVGWSHDEAAAWAAKLGLDGIFAVLSGLDAAKLAQALDRSGFAGDLYLSPWSQDHNLLNYAGRMAGHIFLTSSFNPDDPSEPYRRFRDRHRMVYRDDPVMSGVFGYEIARFVLIALAGVRKPGSAALKRVLLSTPRFEGLQYGFTLDEFGDASMQALVIGMRDGVFVPVGH